jgi:hypothetical protein
MANSRIERNLTLLREQGFRAVPTPSLVCVNFSQLGRWRQFYADKIGSDLSVEIRVIDNEAARSLLESNSELLRMDGARERTYEARVSELLKRVNLVVWQRFAFEIVGKGAGTRFDYGEPANG